MLTIISILFSLPESQVVRINFVIRYENFTFSDHFVVVHYDLKPVWSCRQVSGSDRCLERLSVVPSRSF